MLIASIIIAILLILTAKVTIETLRHASRGYTRVEYRTLVERVIPSPYYSQEYRVEKLMCLIARDERMERENRISQEEFDWQFRNRIIQEFTKEFIKLGVIETETNEDKNLPPWIKEEKHFVRVLVKNKTSR